MFMQKVLAKVIGFRSLLTIGVKLAHTPSPIKNKSKIHRSESPIEIPQKKNAVTHGFNYLGAGPISPITLFDEAPVLGAVFISGDLKSSHLTLKK
jgi:hypothetical protein